MLKFLFIDIFSYHPILNYNKKESFKTCLGAVCTYIFIAILVLTTITFSNELINRKNPNLIIWEVNNSIKNSPTISLDPENFKIAFGIFEKDRMIPFDRTYFEINAKKQSIYLTESGQFLPRVDNLSFTNCNKTNIPNEALISQEDDLLDQRFFCFQPDKNKSLYDLKGFFGSTDLSQIIISFSRCVNRTEDPSAPSKNKIKNVKKGCYEKYYIT